MSKEFTEKELRKILFAIATHPDRSAAARSIGMTIDISTEVQLFNQLQVTTWAECVVKVWKMKLLEAHPLARQLRDVTIYPLTVLRLIAEGATIKQMVAKTGKSTGWIDGQVVSLKNSFALDGKIPTRHHMLVYAALSCGIEL